MRRKSAVSRQDELAWRAANFFESDSLLFCALDKSSSKRDKARSSHFFLDKRLISPFCAHNPGRISVSAAQAHWIHGVTRELAQRSDRIQVLR